MSLEIKNKMALFKNFKQYTHKIKNIRFPISRENPFFIVYFSENSSFIEDYSKIQIRRTEVRGVVIPITKIPRTRLTSNLRKVYKELGLLSYSVNQRFPTDRNLFLDTGPYLNEITLKYKPTTYRQRIGMLLKNFLNSAASTSPINFQKVLIYSVDVTKDLRPFISRKIFPIIQSIKKGDFAFDHLILCTIQDNIASYRLLIKDHKYSFQRVFHYLKEVKQSAINAEEEKEDIQRASNIVIQKVIKDISKENIEKVRASVDNYFEQDKDKMVEVLSGDADPEEIKRITIMSIMYKVNNDIVKSNQISKNISSDNLDKALKIIDQRYVDPLLEPEKTISSTTNLIGESYNIPAQIDEKTPEHIFKKRQVDFEVNLKKDMMNVFKTLETKEIPLKINSLKIVDKEQKSGELAQSDESIVKGVLVDESGFEHEINITIPKIDVKTGTFRVSGQRKCLINQIVLCPISFPHPYDSKFESSFSTFHIESKRTKRENYSRIYIGSYWLPLLTVLFFFFGFEETIKKYGLKYRISNKKEKEDLFAVKISSSEYLIFDNVDTEFKEEICKGFIREKRISEFNITDEFGSKLYFQNLIIKMTGRVNSIYRINTCLENILDPVAKQVLINKQLPSELNLIMEYMARKTTTGFSQKRNDLSNQRIRNSEVIIHLLQKQMLSTYTEYREQRLSGNKEAKFVIPPDKLMSQFVNLDLVTSMEYSNPIEEMATITRISPVGKTLGGIPDQRAIQVKDRGVNPSYFGDVDVVDTPEGGTIGISQQLTVDALITSSRGIIMTKDLNDKEKSGILSTTTSMIPFIECNDGARIMMAASQAKQMLPLKNPTPPAVQSGYESVLPNVVSDNFIKRSPCSGQVVDVKTDNIIIKCKNGKNVEIDITPVHLKSGSGKNTLSTFKTKVIKNQIVKEKGIIAEGACMSNGSISMGRSLLAAYMPYKGYNFEDGTVISESLVENDKLTSLHGIVEEGMLSKNDRLISIVNIGDKTKKGETLFSKTIGEIEELIGYEEIEEDETSSIISGQYIKKSPGGTIVDIEVFSNFPEDVFPALTNLIRRTNKKYHKPSKEKYKIKGISIKGVLIKIKIEQELKISVGDKLSNRYGNKGIISLIQKDSLMPRTPWGDPVEVIFNPLGVINRMNFGQIYELYVGLISKNLADLSLELKDQKRVVNLYRAVFSILDTSKNKQYSTATINRLSKFSGSQFKLMLDQIRESGFVPIVTPPFKAPKNKEIEAALKLLKLKPAYHLYLPDYGIKTKSPVPVGYTYIAKLEHIGEMKVSSRSTGPIIAKTQQPSAGKARLGGQRIGEGDTYSLLSYNCPHILSEEFGPLSDDHVTKNEIISEIIMSGEAKYREPKTSPTLQLLNSYFISLMLEKGE